MIDQGEGIAPDDQEQIFHEFVQLGKTQLTEGTGLGLPISRRLAELLRGSLTVHSEVGTGQHVPSYRCPPTAERVANVRITDQDTTPRASDDRAARQLARDDHEGMKDAGAAYAEPNGELNRESHVVTRVTPHRASAPLNKHSERRYIHALCVCCVSDDIRI